jgi:hypothetical protein
VVNESETIDEIRKNAGEVRVETFLQRTGEKENIKSGRKEAL